MVLAGVQDAQQEGLHLERAVPDLVEERNSVPHLRCREPFARGIPGLG
jgi:hypothetical protein